MTAANPMVRKRLGKWGRDTTPHFGWTVQGLPIDLGARKERCQMCERAWVRWLYTVTHPSHEPLRVGCDCGGWMIGDTERAERDVKDMRNAAAKALREAKRRAEEAERERIAAEAAEVRRKAEEERLAAQRAQAAKWARRNAERDLRAEAREAEKRTEEERRLHDAVKAHKPLIDKVVAEVLAAGMTDPRALSDALVAVETAKRGWDVYTSFPIRMAARDAAWEAIRARAA